MAVPPAVTFPASPHVFVEEENLADADTAHSYQSSGDWSHVAGLGAGGSIVQVDQSDAWSGKATRVTCGTGTNNVRIGANVTPASAVKVPVTAGRYYLPRWKCRPIGDKVGVLVRWYWLDAGLSSLGNGGSGIIDIEADTTYAWADLAAVNPAGSYLKWKQAPASAVWLAVEHHTRDGSAGYEASGKTIEVFDFDVRESLTDPEGGGDAPDPPTRPSFRIPEKFYVRAKLKVPDTLTHKAIVGMWDNGGVGVPGDFSWSLRFFSPNPSPELIVYGSVDGLDASKYASWNGDGSVGDYLGEVVTIEFQYDGSQASGSRGLFRVEGSAWSSNFDNLPASIAYNVPNPLVVGMVSNGAIPLDSDVNVIDLRDGDENGLLVARFDAANALAAVG